MCPEKLYELSRVPNYLGDESAVVDCTGHHGGDEGNLKNHYITHIS